MFKKKLFCDLSPIRKELLWFLLPERSYYINIFLLIVVWFHQCGITVISTNKDHIEKLKADVLELKEAMQKVTTKSKMEESFCELRELIFPTHASTQKDNNDQG